MIVNNVNSLINQQCGFSVWKDSHSSIKRLRCTKNNSFVQLLPQREEDDFYRDTPIFTCKFSTRESSEHLLALANEDGKLAIHDCNSNTRYGIQAHNNAIFDLAWMFDQMKLVTASGDHTSKLYDVGNGEIKEERVFYGHTRSVKTVAFRKDDPSVFATGGRDGDIIIWDTRTNVSSFVGKADRTIPNSHISKVFTPSKSKKKFSTPTQSGIKSVTGLVFQEGNTLVSCGAGDGVIKIWDLRKNYVTYKKEAAPKGVIPYPGNTTKNGYSSLLIDNSGIKLYANCLDNTIYCYNIGTYNIEPIMQYTGHQNSTFYVKSSLCKNGSYLISGSSDENAYIWDTKYSYPLVKLTGHTAEVTCVAWCNKNDILVTCSDDMTHMIWTVGPEQLPEDWDINGRGLVEVLPLENSTSNQNLKRPLRNDCENIAKKIFIECQRCSNATTSKFCENCCVSSKRKSMYELESANKIFQTEFGPRRLFANMNQTVQNDKTDTLAQYLDETDISLTSIEDCEPAIKRPKLKLSPLKINITASVLVEHSDNGGELVNCKMEENVLNNEDYEPQTKMAKLEITPKRNKVENISSPTLNLPNYILDGTAPHLNYSPPKKKCQDWLTKLRIEKILRQEMYDKTIGQSTPKQSKPEVTPKRKYSSPRSPLLRYFRVTNSTQKCEGISCTKFHNCANFSSTSLKQSDS